jgi:hypothetical protein
MSLYEVGRRYGPPLLPTDMMVVDVSPCGRFVTFAAKSRQGVVMELVRVRPNADDRLPYYEPRP